RHHRRFPDMIGLGLASACGFRSWWDRPKGEPSPGDVVAEIAYLERGGALVTLREPLTEALFDPGQIHVPETAIRVTEPLGGSAWPLLLRHVEGDWGAFGRAGTARGAGVRLGGDRAVIGDVARQNLEAIQRNEGRVVSEFAAVNQGRLWIITHLGEGGDTTFPTSDGG